MDDFISEDDLSTLDGFLKYQAIDPAKCTPEELEVWRGCFDQGRLRHETSPKLGLMSLPPRPGEQKYAVAIRDGSDLWLTLWVRCSPAGEIFIMIPRDRDWDPHASYHLHGNSHYKSFRATRSRQSRQPLTAAFSGSEHLRLYAGHGPKSVGAVCDPKAFDGVVIVEPGVLGPRHGSVGVDLVEPGYEAEWERTAGQSFYLGRVHQREVFP